MGFIRGMNQDELINSFKHHYDEIINEMSGLSDIVNEIQRETLGKNDKTPMLEGSIDISSCNAKIG
jgi:hypothetical protein